jgi:DUF4097 and DUF4098 domain-containing protein YvlB
MKKTLKNLFTITLFLIFMLAPLSGKSCHKYEREFKKTYDVHPGMKMRISNRNGKIDIKTWDKEQVEIFAVIGSNKSEAELDKVDIDVSVNENIEIITKYPGDESDKKEEKDSDDNDSGFWDFIKWITKCRGRAVVDYEIKIPAHIVVSYAESTNGEIDLNGTKGPSEVKTTNGRIKIEDVTGDVQARTTNGQVEIENAEGFVNAKTTNGKIIVKGSKGIEKLSTTNGSIEAEIKEIKEGGTEIRTTNGSIELGLAESINAVLELNTSNGRIDIDDFAFEMISQNKNKYMKGKIGKGGEEIKASTINGSIKIGKL